jgi:hypothetical protein
MMIFIMSYTTLDKKVVYPDLRPSLVRVLLEVENIKNNYNNWH